MRTGTTELVVLPTFVALPAALAAAAGTNLRVGAQDLAAADKGAFTGEVSGAELAEIGCTHVEVGHASAAPCSVRPIPCHREDQRALRNRLTPMLCVGEPAPTEPAAAADVCVHQILSALRTTSAVRRRPGSSWPTSHIGPSAQPEPAPTRYVADVCRRVRTALAGQVEELAVIYGGSAGPGLLTALGGAVDGCSFSGRFAHDPQVIHGVLAEAAVHHGRARRARPTTTS